MLCQYTVAYLVIFCPNVIVHKTIIFISIVMLHQWAVSVMALFYYAVVNLIWDLSAITLFLGIFNL